MSNSNQRALNLALLGSAWWIVVELLAAEPRWRWCVVMFRLSSFTSKFR
jgi:hypothetical protein